MGQCMFLRMEFISCQIVIFIKKKKASKCRGTVSFSYWFSEMTNLHTCSKDFSYQGTGDQTFWQVSVASSKSSASRLLHKGKSLSFCANPKLRGHPASLCFLAYFVIHCNPLLGWAQDISSAVFILQTILFRVILRLCFSEPVAICAPLLGARGMIQHSISKICYRILLTFLDFQKFSCLETQRLLHLYTKVSSLMMEHMVHFIQMQLWKLQLSKCSHS